MTTSGSETPGLSRRGLLTTTAIALLFSARAGAARTIEGGLPWEPNAGAPPRPVAAGPWQYFTVQEAAAVEALVDRLIPADAQTPGGRDMGCAVYIDRQLAGPFGRAQGLYMQAPFKDGIPEQGRQSPLTPAQRYRQALQALDAYCRQAHGGRGFAALADEEKDKLLGGLESGAVKLHGADGQAFFELLLKNTKEGFFADPIYGGNREMAAWRMIGFPGARYDYRDWVARHGDPYPLPPVSIVGRPAWSQQG